VSDICVVRCDFFFLCVYPARSAVFGAALRRVVFFLFSVFVLLLRLVPLFFFLNGFPVCRCVCVCVCICVCVCVFMGCDCMAIVGCKGCRERIAIKILW
jgi:hypothetical protein